MPGSPTRNNGSAASGTCENEPFFEEEEEQFYREILEAKAAPGSKLVGWTVNKGQAFFAACGEPARPNFCAFTSLVPGEDIEVTAKFLFEGVVVRLGGTAYRLGR